MFLFMLAYLLLLASLRFCVAGVRAGFGVQTVPVVYPVDGANVLLAPMILLAFLFLLALFNVALAVQCPCC
jgi:hypothetical protein